MLCLAPPEQRPCISMQGSRPLFFYPLSLWRKVRAPLPGTACTVGCEVCVLGWLNLVSLLPVVGHHHAHSNTFIGTTCGCSVPAGAKRDKVTSPYGPAWEDWRGMRVLRLALVRLLLLALWLENWVRPQGPLSCIVIGLRDKGRTRNTSCLV